MLLPEKPFTRREVLAIVNSIYDTLGFAIPTTLQGRLLLRELVQLGNTKVENKILGCDDPLPSDLLKKWLKWRNSLVELNELSIPRCYHPNDFGKIRRFEIHQFSDASERAIATVIYAKLVSVGGNISFAVRRKAAPPSYGTMKRNTRQFFLNPLTLPASQLDITTRKFTIKASKSHTGEYVTQEFGSWEKVNGYRAI